MPYPIMAAAFCLPKRMLSGMTGLLLAIGAYALDPAQDYSVPGVSPGHISNIYALYRGGTPREPVVSGIVRCTKNGDIAITIPRDVPGKYRVRFYNEENLLLFEVRQIRDSLLIVEKYNFRHAGVFEYEVYRDNKLVERNSFRINRSG
jgi:hypothetical protein